MAKKSIAKKVESNEDLLKEILIRLPVKPLLKFKTVSKRWLALISEPRFCHSHTLRQYKHFSHPFPSALMLGTRGVKPSPLQCPIIPLKNNYASSDSSNSRYVKIPRMNITIMQSCNGLLLLEGRPLKNPNHPLKARHYVHNPTTNQHVAINFPTPQFRSSVLSLILCFEPLKSPHFKIFSIRFRDFSNFNDIMNYASRTLSQNVEPDYVLNVYSSETGRWSERGVSFTAPVQVKALYCNGAVFWWIDNAEYSKYFDVENQRFKKFPMPSVEFLKDKIGKYYGESGGRVHVVLQSILDFEIDVLELSEDRRSWSVRFHMKLDSMLAACPRLSLRDFALMDVYCVVRQGKDDVDSMLVFSINGMFIASNFLDSTIKKLSSFSPFLSAGSCDIFHYYENLSAVAPSLVLGNTSRS